jgi:hypothetical protein
MKYIKLFEDFEDNFEISYRPDRKEEPNPNNIQVGDSVKSYRGMGEVVAIEGEYAKVKLHNSKENIATVPLFSVEKIDKSEIESHKVRDTQADLQSLLNSAQDYYDYLKTEAEYVESDEEFAAKVDAEKIYELLEEILIDVMALFRNDNSTSEYREYSELVSVYSLLADVLITIAPDYKEKVDTLYAHFPG